MKHGLTLQSLTPNYLNIEETETYYFALIVNSCFIRAALL